MAHYDFRLRRAYSYEQAFNVMRALRLPYSAAKEMFRRMVFNVVVRNQDDHTKNISFLMGEDGIWRLSPAYDMGYAYNPQGGWTSTHQMSINGKFDDIITLRKPCSLLTRCVKRPLVGQKWQKTVMYHPRWLKLSIQTLSICKTIN